MADEVTIQASISASKGGAQIATGSRSKLITMAGSAMVYAVQSVGFAAAEAVIATDIGTPGYLYVENLDATNYVGLSLDAPGAAPFAKLMPGEFALFRPTAAAIYALANTAACECIVAFVED